MPNFYRVRVNLIRVSSLFRLNGKTLRFRRGAWCNLNVSLYDGKTVCIYVYLFMIYVYDLCVCVFTCVLYGRKTVCIYVYILWFMCMTGTATGRKFIQVNSRRKTSKANFSKRAGNSAHKNLLRSKFLEESTYDQYIDM